MLKIEKLNKVFYPGTPEENIIFDGFNLEIEENKCTAILGPNGCGKSTLFNIISGALSNDGGTIELQGQDISKLSEEKRAKYIGKVSQDPSMGVSPSLTILENMSIAMKKGGKFTFSKLIKKNNEEFIVNKLKELGLGLEKKLNTQVKFLSGGQRQSLSLLMATIIRPELLLLDEHTAALDPKTSTLIMNKTTELISRENITTLMISHNLRHAIQYSSRIIMLNHGKVVLDVESKKINEEQLNRIYNEKIERDETRLVS